MSEQIWQQNKGEKTAAMQVESKREKLQARMKALLAKDPSVTMEKLLGIGLAGGLDRGIEQTGREPKRTPDPFGPISGKSDKRVLGTDPRFERSEGQRFGDMSKEEYLAMKIKEQDDIRGMRKDDGTVMSLQAGLAMKSQTLKGYLDMIGKIDPEVNPKEWGKMKDSITAIETAMTSDTNKLITRNKELDVMYPMKTVDELMPTKDRGYNIYQGVGKHGEPVFTNIPGGQSDMMAEGTDPTMIAAADREEAIKGGLIKAVEDEMNGASTEGINEMGGAGENPSPVEASKPFYQKQGEEQSDEEYTKQIKTAVEREKKSKDTRPPGITLMGMLHELAGTRQYDPKTDLQGNPVGTKNMVNEDALANEISKAINERVPEQEKPMVAKFVADRVEETRARGEEFKKETFDEIMDAMYGSAPGKSPGLRKKSAKKGR